MLAVQIPRDMQTILEKATTNLKTLNEKEQEEKKETLNKAKKTLSFLQEIIKESAVSSYLQAGGRLKVLTKIGSDKYHWIEFRWDNSPKIVSVSCSCCGHSPFVNELSLDFLEEHIGDDYWFKLIYDLSKVSEGKIWKGIRKYLPRI